MNYKMLTCLDAADPRPMQLGRVVRQAQRTKESLEHEQRREKILAFERGDHTPVQVYGGARGGGTNFLSRYALPEDATEALARYKEKFATQADRVHVTWSQVCHVARKLQVAGQSERAYYNWLAAWEFKTGSKTLRFDSGQDVFRSFVEAAEAQIAEYSKASA